MINENRPHFWVSDEEVISVPKDLTARPKQRDIIFAEHGTKLSNGLDAITMCISSTKHDDSLQELGLYVFKVELSEGEKIQSKSELFSKNGMHVNAVKDERHAVVSTTQHQFQILKNRIQEYKNKGTNKNYFDYIENLSPYVGNEKDSSELRKRIYIENAPETIDVQLMLIPNLKANEYVRTIENVKTKIKQTQGVVQQDVYYLSDDTPIIRAVIPSSTINRYENDSAVYRIEETRFFDAGVDKYVGAIASTAHLSNEIDISNLPIVAVLDSGVQFPKPFDQLILEHWLPPMSTGGDSDHGTRVASKVAFSDIGGQLVRTNSVVPRARIIDCNILDGSVPENIMINRIQKAVETYHDITKIFNLSANSRSPIEGDEMSIIGFELDALQLKYGVQFVVSAGNHELWKTETSLADILDDDDSKIAPPGDSMLSIIVGSVTCENHIGSLSEKNIIAPYSRRGCGFAGFSKPDMSAYGGTIVLDEKGANVPCDLGALVMTKNGDIEPDSGTSFTAPSVAGDLAEIQSITPNSDIFLSKALLYHNAQPLWEEDDMEDDELNFIHNLYGRGLSSVLDSKYSSPSKATFVRTGTLNRRKKERVKIYMPELLAAQIGRNIAKVTVTCLSQPKVDRTKGTEYLGAYIRASLKKSASDGGLRPVDPKIKEGRKKWDVCHHFSKMFSSFNSGDWQIWLELFGRWDEGEEDIPYALVVTIEDLSGELDIYNEIQAQNRYQAINNLRVKVNA